MKDLNVINVLPVDAFEDCHIEGSINVPLADLEHYVRDYDFNTPIVVYCASYDCGASKSAWELLKKLGFNKIWAYEGGAAEWYQKGFPVKGSCKKEYLTKSYEPKEDKSITLINAVDLKKMMEEAEIL